MTISQHPTPLVVAPLAMGSKQKHPTPNEKRAGESPNSLKMEPRPRVASCNEVTAGARRECGQLRGHWRAGGGWVCPVLTAHAWGREDEYGHSHGQYLT